MDNKILEELTELLKNVKEPSCLVLKSKYVKMHPYEINSPTGHKFRFH